MTISHPAEGDALVERLIGQWKAVMEACARAAEGLTPVPHRLRLQEREIASQLVGRLLSEREALSVEVARLRREVEEAFQHREHWQTKAQETRTIELEATARASAAEARAERLEGHLRSALAYLDADADLEDPGHEVSRVEAVDLRTGETRVFDVAAARAALQPKGDGGER